jgi:hypothetical protein
MTTGSVITTRNVLFAAVSIALGGWTFIKVNEVSGPTFEPILAACSEYGSSPDFEGQTGYHAFEPAVGFKVFNVFVCLITQFLHELRQTFPAGAFVWGGVVIVAVPFSCMATIEAGRDGAWGPVRYPILCGLLYQLFGISVMMPLVWLPSYIFGRGEGAVSTFRAILALPLNLPVLLLSLVVFVADSKSYLWTLCAGILGGPLLPMTSCVLWGDSPPRADDNKASASAAALLSKSSRACAYVYLATVPIGWVGWAMFLYTALSTYGLDETTGGLTAGLWTAVANDVWTLANASVKFMTIDTIVLWLGMCLCIAVRGGGSSAIKVVALTPLVGPGAACSLILAELETATSVQASVEASEATASGGSAPPVVSSSSSSSKKVN